MVAAYALEKPNKRIVFELSAKFVQVIDKQANEVNLSRTAYLKKLIIEQDQKRKL